MLHFILSPLSRRGLQTLLRWRSSRSHKPRPAAAAGCRLGEPDRNINIMLHQHSIYVRWRCSEVKPLSQVHQALHHPASRHLRRNYNGYYFLTFSVFTHLKKTKNMHGSFAWPLGTPGHFWLHPFHSCCCNKRPIEYVLCSSVVGRARWHILQIISQWVYLHM